MPRSSEQTAGAASLPYPVALRLMAFLPSEAVCHAVLDTSAELRETVAVGLAMEFVHRLRAQLRVSSDGQRAWVPPPRTDADESNSSASPAADADARTVAMLLKYMVISETVPQQLMQEGGRPLQALVAEAAPAGVHTLWMWKFGPHDEWAAKIFRRCLLPPPPAETIARPNCCLGGPCASSNGDRVIEVRFIHHFDPAVACGFGHLECLRVIRDQSTTAVDLSALRSGLTALEWAAIGGHGDCVEQLMQWGVSASTAPNTYGRTLAHYAAQGGHRRCLELARELGLGLDATDATGKTPAFFAAQHGRADALRWLRDQGADVGRADQVGTTACHLAARSGQLNCLLLLHEWGCAHLNAVDTSGCTPIYYAALNGHGDCVAALREWGSDLGALTRTGGTLAHAAAQGGHAACLQLLREWGVDVEKKDSHGHEPRFYAELAQHRQCLAVLGG